jgi:hypothetical protein
MVLSLATLLEQITNTSDTMELTLPSAPAVTSKTSRSKVHLLFWIGAIAVTFSLLVLRRPDAVTHAQFWAEDGVVWYADAYNLGALPALARPRDGYVQVLPRLVAGVAVSVPILRAPLVMNLLALLIQALPALFLVSPRMRNLGSLRLRCILALLYLLVPDSSELHATITDSEFHLAVMTFLLFISQPPRSLAGQCFDVSVLVFSALTGPFCVLLFPVALVLTVTARLHPGNFALIRYQRFTLPWRHIADAPTRRPPTESPTLGEERWRWIQLSLLTAGCLVQGLTVLLTSDARFDTLLGASPGKFVRIIAGQIVVPIFFRQNGLSRVAGPTKITAVALFLTLFAALLFLYAFLRGSSELRGFIFFGLSVLAAALMFPTYEPVHYQWDVFLLPGCGLRYWYVAKLALMATVVWLIGPHRPGPVRLLAAVLACLMVVASLRQWRYPPRNDFQFASYVQLFDQLPSGTPFQIPVLPGGIWVMKLVKR